jgi:hypothetical protein
MKKLLLVLLILIPLAVLANITGSTVLTVGTPQSLLSGCTVPTSSNTPSCPGGFPPAGWTLVQAQGFETGNAGSNGILGTVDGVRPHTGSFSVHGLINFNQAAAAVFLGGSSVGTYTKLYLSFWRYQDTATVVNDEWFICRAVKNFGGGLFQEMIVDQFAF